MASKDFSYAKYMASHRAQTVRRVFRALPHGPRCKLCNGPFAGVARMVPIPNFRPSGLNPNMCRSCFEALPLGGEEMEIGVLFADVRGFTAMAERMTPAETAESMNRFYRVAADTLVPRDALIDKLAGDQVMALFMPPLFEGDTCERMVEAAEELLRAVDWLPLGAGADFGDAFVGNVGPSETAKDFTALGDVVNTAERLQAAAGAGELVLSERVWSSVASRLPEARGLELELKGKAASVAARVVRVVSV